ncbi:MAG: LuxR family transcriptional regulator [Alphaproteobacteria bacterium]
MARRKKFPDFICRTSFDIANEVDGLGAMQDSFKQLRTAALNWGYDGIAYANFLTQLDPVAESRDENARLITYSKDWREHYNRERYQDHDVLFNLAASNSGPILWRDARQIQSLTRMQRRIFGDGYDAGHRHGITMSFHGPQGFSAALSLASSGNAGDVYNAVMPLVGLAWQFHGIYDAINTPRKLSIPPRNIGARERECLMWAARGKSASDIATILGLSERTVETYFTRIGRKLNVHGRIPCVVVATRLGIIQPFREL